ncbi:hypothetical protein RclHR1_06770018 [Rhizophagus clarus]|nr:hypothetical protein RclHR1_06770018 [Rhizophagus clarus]
MMMFIIANLITSAYGIQASCGSLAYCSLCVTNGNYGGYAEACSGTDYNEYHCKHDSCSCQSGGPEGTCSQCAERVSDVGTYYFYESCTCTDCTGPF